MRWDYQPDICKDYKETGFCGFGGEWVLPAAERVLHQISRGIQRDLVQLTVPCLWHADVHLVPYRHLFAELARGAVAELFCITFTSLEAVGGMGFPDPYPTSHVGQCWICRCGIWGTVLVACQS